MGINEAFGWIWITLGFVSGAAIGMGFLKEGFLGGYGTARRRLVRLAHISFFGLGFINVLFAMSAASRDAGGLLIDLASWCFLIGGVLMPACCLLVAWRVRLKAAFAAPVISLLVAGGAFVLGTLEVIS